ncbi:hypothetical protein J4447_03895 [Candidatus Pacearchaeota archaeon]|nr:hypothetical protein [Candidatus Pacearchaeota archaeon]
MSKLSKEKRERIMSNILSLLYNIFPQSLFTAKISEEEARDEEFTKGLLIELEKRGLVKAIRKNPHGSPYSRRIRWTLSPRVYKIYKDKFT